MMGFFFNGVKMLKKILLTLLIMSVSHFVVAGTMGAAVSPCKADAVTIPCPAQSWELGVQGLYLKPQYSASAFLPSVSGGFREVDPGWDWGYRLEGAYHFNMGNDLTINWLHYDANSNLGTFAGAYVQLLPVGAIVVGAPFNSFLNNRLEQANIQLGQHVDFSQNQSGRFYAGLQYTTIQLDATNNFQIPALFAAAIISARTDNNSDFKGVGPSVGMDYSYNIIPGFKLLANAAGSLLYGTTRLENSTIYGNGLIASSLYLNKKSVIPEFEAKLGISYAQLIAHGSLAIEGGYQALEFLDGLQTFLPTGVIASNNFGLYGPYIEAKWIGNV